MAQKPSIPKGTRDFNPEQVAKRNYIFSAIKSKFERFGFQPIETPSFENSDTLMGKYGEEGDRLIFKILESGDYFGKVQNDIMEISLYEDEIRSNLKKMLDIVKVYVEENNIIKEYAKEGQSSRPEFEYDYFIKKININKYSSDFSIKILDEYFKKNERLLFQNLIISYVNTLDSTDWFKGIISSFAARIFEKNLLSYLNENRWKIYKAFRDIDSKEITSKISEKALRYDLTVPFARYVVQHQNDIDFPFKRYQMQPVWRADRPQKGRFREFYQCDADVVGSDSLWQEVEFVQLYDEVFTALKLQGATIKINNRKILSGIAEVIGASDKLIDFTVALDKLDKIGEEKVKEEMLGKGISEEGIAKLQPLFTLKGDFGTQIESLKSILNTSEEGKKGIEELDFINNAIATLGLKSATLQLDVTLARGLNYYTGAIFEVSAPEGVAMGSIGGGGRYDDLTGIFGLKDVSGVGISFGLDRIYLVLEELGLFPETITKSTEVMFINFGDNEALFCLKAVKALREAGINAELYPDKITNGKHMKKQMNYANKRNIPFVVLVGEEELKHNLFTLKNMVSGDQEKVDLKTMISRLK